MSEAPCSRSSAWPRQRSAFTSSRSIPLTMPPHWRANAAHEPTSPPPPIMLTFMGPCPRVWRMMDDRRSIEEGGSNAARDARGVGLTLDDGRRLPVGRSVHGVHHLIG